ncbi:hypothetical protein HHK36_030529 [Tetracentron sinense]|uniref:Nuclease HARBI1 n=1 Tax=Tetracentron sinense TaxID=13715 RepID=A0A835D0R0_TETSI|nr:hypothetical protein HHK36_030529 [Tetracentron sinense]
MQRSLFLRIQSAGEAHDPYFVQKTNVVGTFGLSSLQKITTAMRMLAYGVTANYVDKSPNNDDIARLLAVGENRGFPEMLGSIDCMHWKWKNCPTAWKGMYSSHVQRSSVFTDIANGRHAPVNYSINGHDNTMDYYLADGIYPKWSIFVKTIPSPQGNRQKYFAATQESAKKDVERAFGVLQARFAIVRGPACFWECNTLKDIMKACIIMHNMIVEDERDVNGIEDFNYNAIDESSHVPVFLERTTELMEFIREGTTGPVSKKNLHPIAKMLFSDCSISTKANLRMIEEWVTKNQADEAYMLTHQIKELIESLESSQDILPISYSFLQGLPLSSMER